MSAQVSSLQLNVEHLKKQSEMNRIKVSQASREYVEYLLMNALINLDINYKCINCVR